MLGIEHHPEGGDGIEDRLRTIDHHTRQAVGNGIRRPAAAARHLRHTAGVMLGRAAYHDPMLLSEVDHRFFGEPMRAIDLTQVMTAMAAYAENELKKGARLNQITRHMLGLANGRPGARTFRQILSVDAARRGAGPEMMLRALAALEREPVAA